MGLEPSFQIHLKLPDIRILSVTNTDRGELVISIESTHATTRCRHCGREIRDFHCLGEPIRLRHLPVFDQPVFLEIRPKRYRCNRCEGHPTSTQRCDWYSERSPNTRAWDQMALRILINSTVTDTGRKLGVSEETIDGVLTRHIATEVDWDEYKKLGRIGIDEIALKKGHRDYVAIITAPLVGGGVAILAVLEDRKKETVKAFLETIPDRLRLSIERVNTDMHEGYVRAVEELLPWVKIVVDRFHVAKAYGECADQARKQELRRLKKQLTKAQFEPLKGVMWPFRKDPEDLEPEERKLLDRVLERSPALKQVYDLREKLTAIFDRPLSKSGAQCALRAWIKQVRASGLTYFDSFLTTLDNWMDEITNYFLDRETSGFVEGFNNKVKVLKRRCYGIFNVGRIFQQLYLDLEGYRLFGFG